MISHAPACRLPALSFWRQETGGELEEETAADIILLVVKVLVDVEGQEAARTAEAAGMRKARG